MRENLRYLHKYMDYSYSMSEMNLTQYMLQQILSVFKQIKFLSQNWHSEEEIK